MKRGESDSHTIEKNLFEYERSFIKDIVTKIDARLDIYHTESIELIKMLLSLKQRNITMKEFFLNPKIQDKLRKEQIEKILKSSRKYVDEFGQATVDEITSYIIKNFEEAIQKQQTMSDVFNASLIDFLQDRESIQDGLVEFLVSRKFMVFYNDQNKFISSDNPGYTVHDDDKIANMFFGSARMFAFPLSPRSTLVIDLEEAENHIMIARKFKYIKVHNEMIRLINNGTVLNSKELIFSSSKDHLSKVVGRFRK